MKYELKQNTDGIEFIVRTNNDDSISWIPIDEANSEYQAYLNKDKPQVEHLTEIIPADEA